MAAAARGHYALGHHARVWLHVGAWRRWAPLPLKTSHMGGVEMPTVVLEDAAHGAWRRRTGEKRDSERRVQHSVGELVLGLGQGKTGYIPSPSGGTLKGLSLNRGLGHAARRA